jgi:polar amino acid transport system substrate-binding protein
MHAAVLASICSFALADSGLEHAKTHNKLIVGLNYVVPEYRAGMKFRTPEAIDQELAKDLARRLHLPLVAVRLQPATQAALPTLDNADIMLAAVPDKNLPDHSATVIPTGYFASPMAIMRSDTDIKAWEQLKGRKVCVSEGGLYVGTLAEKYGAIEKVQKAPADSLLALRVGDCDAAVHDSAMLEELIKLPEWKKFSARLPTGPHTALAFVVPAADTKSAAFLKQVVNEWSAKGLPEQLTKEAAHRIAFEVYLDQNVPDCH